MLNTLQVQHLHKKYKSRQVVKDVSLHINRGEVIGLLGPNGAGKTTSFYMIVGLIPVDGGNILLDDQDITRLPVHARAQLGISYLPQETSIFRKLTVAQNIMAILELRSDLTKSERKLMLDQLLEEFRITHIRDTIGISLSGGERRRAEIARALATEPKFILLDEPFAGIDPISVFDVKRIINHLRKRGIGILITDHNVRDTLNICERAYIVNQGKIICEGNPETILVNNEVRAVYLGEEFDL
ncbi:MAG: LPS export ABC transporter ATP-binding protein [Gammaproteobacteria bacterium]|nr:LPS export ABC transporter ATP-binding protein [Gammaproteobacteria bacterium]MCW5582748.1 LPS export ABC transporter ATP-binding protein [Gammaproteobacteria bacterium]